LKVYDLHQVHNMFAITCDLHFKSLQVVENYVGHGDCICLVSKYDANMISHFLTMVFEASLNHIPYLSFKDENCASFLCMIIDWMWLQQFYWGRIVCVWGEEKNMEEYCTWHYVMENGWRLSNALFIFICIDL